MNNVICKDEVDDFFCLCFVGYIGKICENDIDECMFNFC